MFVDEVTITVRSGDGGRGVVSFRREARVPRGGPDGGDGGRGGDVVFRTDPRLSTLLDLQRRPAWRARPGAPGAGKNCSGRSGRSIAVRVPPGTIVADAETGEVIADLVRYDATLLVARGGRGGRGNQHFATATHQTPREAELGGEGVERRLRLTLKLVADVGLVGRPNAGKSSLLSRISAARPKVAGYPFTTLAPVLGVVDLGDHRTMVVADLPGLIEGAHQGIGLGDRFLRHMERTGIVLHLVDVAPMSGPTPEAAYEEVRREMALYSPALAAKPEVVVATKADLTDAAEGAGRLASHLGRPVPLISAVTGEGVAALIQEVAGILPRREEV